MMETDGINIVHKFSGKEATICDRDNKPIKKGLFIPVDVMKQAEVKGFDNRGGSAGRLIDGKLVFSLCESCAEEFIPFAPNKAFVQPLKA